jgi:hypothetical protein
LLPDDDEITSKLAMLFEGQCEGLGSTHAARKFGYTKQRYFQLLEQFGAYGALALQSKAREPKTNYRRTEEMVRQIIRHRFLDPDASAEVIAQKLQQARHLISIRSVERVISDFGLQKKLYACRPKTAPQHIETQRTRRKRRIKPCDPASLEREVRQLLADKISGNQVGIWLLAPEHLRLGTWDLLCAWSQCSGQTVWPRMAIHELLGCHTVDQAQALQVALGKIRRASGHFQGRLLGIDPHRIKSSTKRQLRRHRFSADQKALKMAQCFFCLDLDSRQPLCFTLASAAKTVTQATMELLELSQQILNPSGRIKSLWC